MEEHATTGPPQSRLLMLPNEIRQQILNYVLAPTVIRFMFDNPKYGSGLQHRIRPSSGNASTTLEGLLTESSHPYDKPIVRQGSCSIVALHRSSKDQRLDLRWLRTCRRFHDEYRTAIYERSIFSFESPPACAEFMSLPSLMIQDGTMRSLHLVLDTSEKLVAALDSDGTGIAIGTCRALSQLREFHVCFDIQMDNVSHYYVEFFQQQRSRGLFPYFHGMGFIPSLAQSQSTEDKDSFRYRCAIQTLEKVTIVLNPEIESRGSNGMRGRWTDERRQSQADAIRTVLLDGTGVISATEESIRKTRAHLSKIFKFRIDRAPYRPRRRPA